MSPLHALLVQKMSCNPRTVHGVLVHKQCQIQSLEFLYWSQIPFESYTTSLHWKVLAVSCRSFSSSSVLADLLQVEPSPFLPLRYSQPAIFSIEYALSEIARGGSCGSGRVTSEAVVWQGRIAAETAILRFQVSDRSRLDEELASSKTSKELWLTAKWQPLLHACFLLKSARRCGRRKVSSRWPFWATALVTGPKRGV